MKAVAGKNLAYVKIASYTEKPKYIMGLATLVIITKGTILKVTHLLSFQEIAENMQLQPAGSELCSTWKPLVICM